VTLNNDLLSKTLGLPEHSVLHMYLVSRTVTHITWPGPSTNNLYSNEHVNNRSFEQTGCSSAHLHLPVRLPVFVHLWATCRLARSRLVAVRWQGLQGCKWRQLNSRGCKCQRWRAPNWVGLACVTSVVIPEECRPWHWWSLWPKFGIGSAYIGVGIGHIENEVSLRNGCSNCGDFGPKTPRPGEPACTTVTPLVTSVQRYTRLAFRVRRLWESI